MAARSRLPPARRPRAWAAPVLVGLAALLAYANSLRNGFVWDDPIILSRQLIVFHSAGDVFAPPRDIPQFSPDYYRPLTIASYLLDRAVGGDRPFAFHLSVVLAHAATALLVYALALQLSAPPLPRGHLWPRGRAREGARAATGESPREPPRSLGAFVAGALFALHPIHSESVAWAAGRSDVLATGFLLAALLIHGRPRPSWSASTLAGLCAAAALGAKETAVALYPLMVLRDLLVPAAPHRSPADAVRGYAGPLVAGGVYLVLRRHALGELVGSAPEALPAGQRSALDLVAAIGVYLEKLLWPAHLNAYIDHIAVEPLTIALAVLLMGGLCAALWSWRRGAARDGLPLFALAWLVLTLMPSLAIVWKIPDAPLAERYLYLPSVGLSLLAGDLVARLWARASARARPAIASGLGLLLLAAGAGTVRRNPVWHDDIALWTDTEPKSRVSGMAARGLGTAYQQTGRAADARAAFERALGRRNSPRGLQVIHNNLGTLAMYDGDYAAARRHYEAALAANPNGADTLFNLGLAVLQGGGRSPESARAALPYYQRAQRLDPHDPDVEAALAQAYSILGDGAAAAQHASRALALGAQGPTAESLRATLRNTGASSTP
jgi:tetratricopeptide (TPR) repeat protein